MIFGFGEAHRTEQVILGLTLAAQRGAEWHSACPVVIVSGDIKAALTIWRYGRGLVPARAGNILAI